MRAVDEVNPCWEEPGLGLLLQPGRKQSLLDSALQDLLRWGFAFGAVQRTFSSFRSSRSLEKAEFMARAALPARGLVSWGVSAPTSDLTTEESEL